MAVVFGARNIGRAVTGDRLERGWRVLAVSRTRETLERLSEYYPEVTTVAGDASNPHFVEEVLARAQRDLGPLGLVVNAVTAPPRDQGFGGGPLAEAPPERLDDWMAGFVPHAWAVLRASAAAMTRNGHGTIIQVSGGSARRAFPGRGAWGAAQAAARALTHAAAQELRPVGVHVALLIADGMVRTDRNPMVGRPEHDALNPEDVAAAVAYLEAQNERAWSHELVMTPAGDTWVP